MLKNWRTTKFALAASVVALVLCGGTAAADTGGAAPHWTGGGLHAPIHHWAFPQGAFGTVSSVNGDSTSGACGTAGATGSFAVTGWKATVTTVDVTSATTFAGSLADPPTFANVCVGKLVGAVGTVADDTVTAAKVFVIRAQTPPTEQGAFGTVTSVNGVTTTGTCGTAGSAGSFTLTSWKSAGSTVDVTTTTTFNDPAADPPSFADVCVGSLVGAVGTVASDTVTASKVCVVPTPAPPVPTGSSPPATPVPPATGATGASTPASTGPALAAESHPGSGGPGSPVVGHDPSPAAPHGFGQSGFGAAPGPSGRSGSGTPGGSDPHSGYGGYSDNGNNQPGPSGGFSGQGHGGS
jgi:hypothetical protein